MITRFTTTNGSVYKISENHDSSTGYSASKDCFLGDFLGGWKGTAEELATIHNSGGIEAVKQSHHYVEPKNVASDCVLALILGGLWQLFAREGVWD